MGNSPSLMVDAVDTIDNTKFQFQCTKTAGVDPVTPEAEEPVSAADDALDDGLEEEMEDEDVDEEEGFMNKSNNSLHLLVLCLAIYVICNRKSLYKYLK